MADKSKVFTIKKGAAVMGKRSQEIRPVGAWVQPEMVQTINVQNAVLSAEQEERRLRTIQHEKAEKLQRFQAEVRRRVQALDNLKKQQALERSCQAVEDERNVVRQSTFAAEKSTPRKNRCTVRSDNGLSIKHTMHTDKSSGDDAGYTEHDAKFEEHTNKVRKFTKQARANLTSRKVMTQHYIHDDLPGGWWEDGMSNTEQKKTSSGSDVEEDDKENTGLSLMSEPKIVQFETKPSLPESRKNRIIRKSAQEISGDQLERCPTVPNIYPGVETEEERVRTQGQRAMYRRLFMDIEREQVRENQRRRDHRKKIIRLKKDAEVERKVIEDQAQRLVEPTDPVTGETEQESLQREVLEELAKGRQEQRLQQQYQKQRDTERFLGALKRNLQEKIRQQNLDLPSLCCCGTSIWDTNPDTCANNCVFYKNPKAYARALQSLLATCDVV